MKISGMQKLSLLDFPSKTSCIIFTQGCNYKCPFCHNSDLINYCEESLISEDYVLDYLKKRKNLLDGLVISGGEPTVQFDLKTFIKKVRNLGYSIKLDTNGTNPKLLKELIDEKLIDYIAMDIKTGFADYELITKIKNVDINKIIESVNLIKESNIDHEFRTTIMKNYHDIAKLKEICEYLGAREKYYLQNFEDSDGVMDKTLIEFSKEELNNIQDYLTKDFPNVLVRGL